MLAAPQAGGLLLVYVPFLPLTAARPHSSTAACLGCLPRLPLPACRWKAQLTVKEMCRDQWAWASQNPAGYLTGASEDELKLAKEKGLL